MANLSPEVSAVLSRSRIAGSLLYLPPEQLDRRLYEKVNAALSAMGGSWKRSLKAHQFPSDVDVTAVVQAATRDGKYTDPKSEFEFFETPPAVVSRIIQLSGLEERTGSGIRWRILEPSAGRGAIVTTVRSRFGISPFCCELMPENRKVLQALSFDVVADYFLTYWPDTGFDLILANPPFSSGQDCDHVRHMYDLLSPGGRLVSVMSTAWTFRNDRKFKEFRMWAEELEAEWEELEANAFKSSGTGVNTGIIMIDKGDDVIDPSRLVSTIATENDTTDTDHEQESNMAETDQNEQTSTGSDNTNNPATGTGTLFPGAVTYSLMELVEPTGISYQTLIRYTKAHADRIPSFGEGRKKRYPQEAVEILKQIRNESVQGRPRTAAAGNTATTPARSRRTPPARHVQPSGAPTTPRRGGRPAGRGRARQESATASAAGTGNVGAGVGVSVSSPLSTLAMDEAMRAAERAQLVTRLETIRQVIEPWQKEAARIERVLGLEKQEGAS